MKDDIEEQVDQYMRKHRRGQPFAEAYRKHMRGQLIALRDAVEVSDDELAELTAIPVEARDPAEWGGEFAPAWRFGYLTEEGAVASPWARSVSWPNEGLKAVCAPTFGFGGLKIYREHPMPPKVSCSCGLYSCRELPDLLAVARVAWDNAQKSTKGIRNPEFFKHLDVYTTVVYEAQTWGLRQIGGGLEERWRYARVKPGGRAYVRADKAHLADALAARYGLDVTVTTTSDQSWLDEIEGATL